MFKVFVTIWLTAKNTFYLMWLFYTRKIKDNFSLVTKREINHWCIKLIYNFKINRFAALPSPVIFNNVFSHLQCNTKMLQANIKQQKISKIVTTRNDFFCSRERNLLIQNFGKCLDRCCKENRPVWNSGDINVSSIKQIQIWKKGRMWKM